MSDSPEVVITGIGVVSPIGIGVEPFIQALLAGQSGVRPLKLDYDYDELPISFGGQVLDFDGKQYVRPRKSLKVMCRDIQMGFSAATMATDQAAVIDAVEPERFGVVYGADLMYSDLQEIEPAFRRCMASGEFDFSLWSEHAMNEVYPLWMLKYLPNMPACHVAISVDARGPNNTMVLGEVSSLLAAAEAVRVIRRGRADVMIAGGTSTRLHPTTLVRSTLSEPSQRRDDPAAACRPFDADRDGMVCGEGAAAYVLERREHAEARGARILARITGTASGFALPERGLSCPGGATDRVIREALAAADLAPGDVGHVNAHGLSTRDDDRVEAEAIAATLGDVPVIAPKSNFGNLGASSGAVEMAASLLAFQSQQLPPTLNYERPDAACPVNVVHGQPADLGIPTAVVLNHSPSGQSTALVLDAR